MDLDFIEESSEDKRERISTELTGWEQVVFEIGDEEQPLSPGP
jgi:hypothetical protein